MMRHQPMRQMEWSMHVTPHLPTAVLDSFCSPVAASPIHGAKDSIRAREVDRHSRLPIHHSRAGIVAKHVENFRAGDQAKEKRSNIRWNSKHSTIRKNQQGPSPLPANAYSQTHHAYRATIHGQSNAYSEHLVKPVSSPSIYSEQYHQTETGPSLTDHARPVTEESPATIHFQPSRPAQIVPGPQVAKESPTMAKTKDLKADDIVIAIIGPTGSGKSTFIRSASGMETNGVGHALKPFTSQILAIRFWDQECGRNIVLLDTPGFDSTFNSDLAILKLISNWLSSSYNTGKRLSGIFYFHRITDNRIGFAPMRSVRVFRELCGDDALAKVHLITTMWDEVDSHVGETRLNELGTNYWKPMIAQGALMARCRIEDGSPKELIRQILALGKTQTNQPSVDAKRNLFSGPANAERHPQRVEEDSGKDQGRRVPQISMQSPPSTNKQHFQTVRRLPQVSEASPAMVKLEDLEDDDVVIAIMGPTGAGKSTFICSASGIDTREVSHSLKPVTSQILAIRFWDHELRRHVVLVDTPGFDITFNSDRVILNMISNWLNSSDKNKRVLSGILYLHRITDNRMADAPLRNVRVFKEFCGRDALAKIYLVTTMWDEIDSKDGERKLNEIRTDHWKPMVALGAQIANCRNDDDSPKKLIRQILDQEDPRRVLLLLEEIGELKKEVIEIPGGQQLSSQLETMVQKQTEVRQRIDKEKKISSQAGDVEELRKEYNELWVQIDDKLRQMRELKLSRSSITRRTMLLWRRE